MKRDESNKTLTPTGMAGMAVIGGIVGAGMALFLSDKNRRQKIADMFTEFTDQAGEWEEGLVQQVRKTRDQITGRVNDATDRVRDMANDLTDDAEESAREVKKTARKVRDDAEDKAEKAADRAEKTVDRAAGAADKGNDRNDRK